MSDEDNKDILQSDTISRIRVDVLLRYSFFIEDVVVIFTFDILIFESRVFALTIHIGEALFIKSLASNIAHSPSRLLNITN